ncbi:MAG: hypothetical protein J6P16_04280 [Eubacterium sp.]|nr:hypothetical protein [Eubacterium sp.]
MGENVEQRENEQEAYRLNDESRKTGNGKSTPGYINRFRRINIIWLLVWIMAGVALFIAGLLIWKTRANILTVLAVLMVLPGAKRIIALIAVGKKKSVAAERCSKVEKAAEPFIYAGDLDLWEYEPEEHREKEIPYNVIFTDYVFTSTEKIMSLEFMVVTDNNVYILPWVGNSDQEYVIGYLKNGIAKWNKAMKVEVFWDDEKLLEALKKRDSSGEDSSENRSMEVALRERRETLAYLKSLAV